MFKFKHVFLKRRQNRQLENTNRKKIEMRDTHINRKLVRIWSTRLNWTTMINKTDKLRKNNRCKDQHIITTLNSVVVFWNSYKHKNMYAGINNMLPSLEIQRNTKKDRNIRIFCLHIYTWKMLVPQWRFRLFTNHTYSKSLISKPND